MGLEKGVARKKLVKDAANSPLVNFLIPWKLKNDFEWTVMACTDQRCVLSFVVTCTSEVDNFNLGVREFLIIK